MAMKPRRSRVFHNTGSLSSDGTAAWSPRR